MSRTTLRKVGGSMMLAVPPALLEALHLEAGAQLQIEAKDDTLLIRRETRPRYTLAELLAQGKTRGRRSKEDQEWLDSGPVGRELI